MDFDTLLWLIPALPLAGFVINGLFGSRLSNPVVAAIACLGPFVAFLLSSWALYEVHHGGVPAHAWWVWMSTGDLRVNFGLHVDALTAVMLMNVTGVGTAIHLYSYGYMHEDESFARFMAYLNLFLAAMLILIMGDSLPLLFVGWEGVGLCSYLLIGFWYKDFANVDAGRKAFVVNRIGDFSFLVGMFTMFTLTGSLEFSDMETALAALDPTLQIVTGPFAGWTVGQVMTLAALALFGGATGKSAQIPLYTWLPDAMAGPTPVSALIHAATMVTAGIYVLGRMDFLFANLPDVTVIIALVAASTALLSGIIAVAQNDIKKVLAYSTVSQLGFMFAGMATTIWFTGLFHVITHAFFKALLFLGAGAVIHALHGEQDIRKMGGLWHDLRGVAVMFIIGSLALAGVPPFAGFWSKDEILGGVHLHMSHEGGWWIAVWWMLVISALLTAFYTTRLVILTFFGKPADHHRHLHHPHWTMTSVLGFLTVLSLFGGALSGPIEHLTHGVWVESEFLHHVSHEDIHHSHQIAMAFSVGAVLLGIGAGVVLYGVRKEIVPGLVAGPLAGVHRLVVDKFRIDELYDAVFVRPTAALARALFGTVDRAIIDGGMVEGSGKLVVEASAAVRQTQMGAVSVAAAATLVGAVAVLLWVVANG